MSYLNKLKITFSVVGVVMPCCGCSIKANLLFAFTERFPSVCPSVGLSVSLHHWSIITTPMTSCFLSAGKGQWRRWGGGAGGQGPLHGRVLRTGETARSGDCRQSCDHWVKSWTGHCEGRKQQLGTLGLFSLRQTITQRSLFAPKQRHKGVLRQMWPKTQK